MTKWNIATYVLIAILMILFPYLENKYEFGINNDEVMSTVTYHIEDFKIVPHTLLTEEQLKIQDEQGCIPCHPK
jgi:hypothetical protein